MLGPAWQRGFSLRRPQLQCSGASPPARLHKPRGASPTRRRRRRRRAPALSSPPSLLLERHTWGCPRRCASSPATRRRRLRLRTASRGPASAAVSLGAESPPSSPRTFDGELSSTAFAGGGGLGRGGRGLSSLHSRGARGFQASGGAIALPVAKPAPRRRAPHWTRTHSAGSSGSTRPRRSGTRSSSRGRRRDIYRAAPDTKEPRWPTTRKTRARTFIKS